MSQVPPEVKLTEPTPLQSFQDRCRVKADHEVVVLCYEEKIPDFVAREMDNLYENFFSSFTKFSAMKEAVDVCVYVVFRGGRLTEALLFRNEGKRIHVLNEFISIGSEELCRFAGYIFSRYHNISAISFRAVQPDIHSLPFPFQRHNCIEDIVLKLPASRQEYEDRLSKKLRSNIKTYLNRVKRDHPSFEFEIQERNVADERHIREIIRFNRERMVGKSKTPGILEQEAKEIVELVKSCGLIAIVKINGTVCAGRILFRIGQNYFSRLNAHSPAFNEYRLGTLCNFLSICECITRGGRELHFLWGREEFKYRFLGDQRDFDELIVYRSALHMALNGKLALRTAVNGWVRLARLWLLDPKRKDHLVMQSAKRIVRSLRG